MGTVGRSLHPTAMGSRRGRRAPGAMEFALPIRDQVRLGDLSDREPVRPAVTLNLREPILGPAERSGEIAPPLRPFHASPVHEPNAHVLPGEPRKVSFSPKGPIK